MVFFIEENWQLLKAYLQGVRVLRRLPREMVDPAFLQQRLQRLAPAPQEKPDDRQASSHPRNPQTGGQSGGGALGGRRRASTASAAAADARNGSQPQRGAPALEIRCDGAVIREYESVLAGARRAVKARGGTGAAFPATLTLFFAVRLLAVAAAATGSPAAALLLCAAQFAVAPYSLFVSLTALLALAPVLFCGHYAVWFALRAALRAALPRAWAAAHLEVTHTFIAVFFAVDQLLCALCVYATPRGRSAPVSARRLLQSVVFGFLNTKTYWLVLLFCMRAWGVRLEVVVLGVDYALGASRRVGALIARHTMHWAPLFYHQHRMAHLPHVYEHAHKFHHYLHDTTAFDAHIYGSGAPEEFFMLLLDSIPAMLWGVPPASLSGWVLWNSWTNKVGHTRKADGSGGVNAHADHHTRHNKNYGIFYMNLDMVFGTAVHNDVYPFGAFEARRIPAWEPGSRTERSGDVTLRISPVGGAESGRAGFNF